MGRDKMSIKPWEWTEQNLTRLFGQSETIRLEFKNSKIFNEKKLDRTRDALSKEVSAFANSEGGTIVIGIEEERIGKSRVAKGFDEGVDRKIFYPERVQQLVESNISPSLVGIRIKVINISNKVGNVAYVIYVPKGVTAYQASDKRYYSRSEYEVKPMPDHEIRLRMMKGQMPQVKIGLSKIKLITAEEEYRERQNKFKELKSSNDIGDLLYAGRQREQYEKPISDYDEFIITLIIMNTGEVTLKDFLLTLASNIDSKLEKSQFRFSKGEQIKSYSDRLEPVEKLFPGQQLLFPKTNISLKCPVNSYLQYKRNPSENEIIIYWTVFLDDGPPCRGEIFLFSEYESMSKNGV
jgi:hypothetical protein